MPNIFTSGEVALKFEVEAQTFRRFAYERLGRFGFKKGRLKLYREDELPAIEIELRRAGLITSRPGVPTLTA